ncbi:MAG: Rho termination factor N-terminal domain-containing protein, partial [Clostridia bacterium]|nr:Rho termination factor N-terminal domain-containing protein [Clostridia bacterium]
MDLVGRSMVELREIAEELGIKNVAKLRKNELLDALLEYEKEHKEETTDTPKETFELNSESDEFVEGILELLPDGYGFLRGNNYLSTPK